MLVDHTTGSWWLRVLRALVRSYDRAYDISLDDASSRYAMVSSREHVRSLLGAVCLLLTTGACATTDTAVTSSAKLDKALAVPADYRQQVTRYFAAKIQGGKILRAEIALPGVWAAPFGLTGPRPIVCAKWVSQGPRVEQKHSLVFTFENGEIAEAFDPGSINPGAGGAFDTTLKEAATCGKLAYVPFPEIMK